MYIHLGDDLKYREPPRKTDREKAEIAEVVRGRFGGDMTQVKKPDYCEYCLQYEKFGESKYCQRCIQTVANQSGFKAMSARRVFLVVLVLAAIVAVLVTLWLWALGAGYFKDQRHTIAKPVKRR